jgi:L-lactate dehydrogenase (cytochrome)
MRRLPASVFDYVDGAAEDELTASRNLAAFRRLEFRPRVLRDVGSVDGTTTLFGRELPIPLILAPTGFTRIVDSQGELAVARAAARAGIPYTLSTLSTRSIEEVAHAAEGPRWFQVYVWRDRGLVEELIVRAKASGYEALVLTVDTPKLGRRERDVRRGFTLPPRIGLGTIIDGITHPRWLWEFLNAEPITFANLADRPFAGVVDLSTFIDEQFDPSLSWSDVDWIRSIWEGPIVVKGIQGSADARLAVAAGADAIALSNHGGRQLDGAPIPLELLATVRDAVRDDIVLIYDGGVRRGSDIVKAIALGATACMAGRAYLYGLGAAGESGVDFVLRMFLADVHRTMALCGVTSVSGLTPAIVAWRSAEPAACPDAVAP